MLLQLNYEVLQSLILKFVFDDEKIKKTKIELGDYISIVFNKNGKRKYMDGYVKRIYQDDGYRDCNEHWTIIVDHENCSNKRVPYSHCNSIERIPISKILDIDVLRRKSESYTISTPNNIEEKITDIKLVGNTVMISQDNGTNWVKMVDLPVDKPDEDNKSELYKRIDDIVPDNLRSDVQTNLINGILGLITELAEEHKPNCRPSLPQEPDSNGVTEDVTMEIVTDTPVVSQNNII